MRSMSPTSLGKPMIFDFSPASGTEAVRLVGNYSPWLVALSLSVSVLTSSVAMHLAGLAQRADSTSKRQLALGSGAFAIGLGVWAMHFVGMLAFDLCVTVQYAPFWTIVSLLPATAAAWVALHILAQPRPHRSQVLMAGVLTGAGIGAMHYMGMAGMLMAPVLSYDPVLFAASIVFAIFLATVALWIKFALHEVVSLSAHAKTAIAGTVAGFSIAGMHYLGMAAAQFTGQIEPNYTLTTPHLAIEVALVVLIVLLLTGGVNAFLSFMETNRRLLHEQAQLKRREQELAVAYEAAQAASRSKDVFLSSVSHELRTPLNAILGFSQVLESDEALNADQRESVEEILIAGRQLNRLVNDVLDLSTINAGDMALSLAPCPLNPILLACELMIRPQAKERGIAVSIDTCSGLSVLADADRLEQILLNLLSNAVKFNQDNGLVGVTVQATDDGLVRIRVADTGHGIAKASLPDLFTPFSRLGVENSNIKGTGVGLCIAKQLAAQMGGFLEVDSEWGVGSTFSVVLPGSA